MVFKTTEKITISVVGYPGSGTGVRQHVGKSCLINRFMVPYIINENHLSVLSLSDFDSEVISSSHWLYWGENSVDTGSNKLQIRVIEQCDFVDDHSFQPFFERRTYTERCLDHKITVHSRKLSYVCKEQLGHESAFPQVYLEPTTLYIDVFVYVYDMSLCGPPAVQQAAFLEYVITRLSSLKFPVIIATSKHDTNVSAQASILFNNTLHRCKRHCVRNLCIVETSSRLNVNVKTVFQCAAIFGHHKRTSKLRSGPLYCSLKKSEVRKSFTMCFRKSMCSSVPWFQYNTSLCDTNLSSVGSDSPFVQSLTLPNGHNKLRIPERITLPQMIAVTDSSIPVTNPDLLSKRKADQLSTVLFSGACFLQNSSVQDITLPKTSDACDPSVLPTPPPPLSPGPHNIISFEPNGSTTEIYKSIALSPECSDLSHDTRLENPFVEINLRGHVDTSNYIATAIHDLCLLEHYTSKNGHQFRFLLRSNSKNRPSQLPIIPNPFPFYSDPSNRRLNGLTVQPVHMSMTTSQMSAFSAPNRSPLGSSFGGIFNDNHKNNKDLNPIAQRLHDDLTPVNGNLTPFNLYNLSYSNSLENLKANHLDTLAECCIYLFIYKNIDELLACYKQLKRNKLISTTQKTINVLAYLSCSSCNTLERRNAILSGLAISSCCRIPYLIINSESTPVFLDNLLYLAFNYQIGNDETTHTSNPNNSFVDWRCFTNVDYLSFFPEFICSPITVWDELITEGKFQFVGLLTALILSNCHPLSDCTHSHDTNHTFFHLPLTSVREDAQSYYKNTKQNFSCLYAHFVQLDQVESVLYRSPMTYSLRALLIHYSSSSWSDVGIHIENSLKKLCSLFDSSTFGDDNFTPVILMVAFHSGSSQQIPVEVEGIVRGLKLIQHLAQDYGCSLLLPSSEYDAVKVQFGKSPISSCLSTGYESDHINCFQHPFICESTQSRKDAKFSLGFLSVSRSDDVRAELYKRVFEGKFSDLYSSSGTSKTFSDDSVCYKVSVNNNRYCSNIRPSNDCMRKPQLVSNSQNVNSLRSSLLHHHNDVIALPWLPFSATDAFRLKSFRPPPTQSSFSETPGVKNSNSNIIGELYNHKYLSQQSILSSAEFGGVLSSVLCGQAHRTLPTSSLPQNDMLRPVYPQSCSTAVPLPSINSSVEEYYAELPKVTQSVSLELESCRPHPNRPKRPHHHTDSAYSRSSSPLLSNRQNLLRIPTVFDQSRTDLCNSAFTENSLLHTNDNQTLDNSSTVYAEVNDAFVYKTLPQYFPLSFPSNKPASHVDHYELTDCSLQQPNNLTFYPSLSHTDYTSKICDNAHKNGSSVARDSNKIFYSNSSRLNQLSSSFTQHKVSSNPSFGRSSSQFNPKFTNLPALPLDETSLSTSIHSCSNFFPPVSLLWTPTQVVCLPIACSTYLANGCPTLLSSWSTCKQNTFSAVNFKEISDVPDNSHRLRHPAVIFPIESSNSLLPALPVGAPCESPSVSQRYQKRHPTRVDPVVSNISPIICDLSNHRKRFSLNILTAAVRRYNIWSRYISHNNHNSKT